MLSFSSSLSSDNEAFAIFVNDKFHFKDRKNLLSKEANKKINCEKKLINLSLLKSRLSGYKSILLIFLFCFKCE